MCGTGCQLSDKPDHLPTTDVVVPADAEVRVDAAECCDDGHSDDARNDARYDSHLNGDVVPVDGAHRQDVAAQVDVVVRVDAAVVALMQIDPISGI
jgi:hypothetical protein